MDFDLNEEQRLIADNVARLMKDHYRFESRKAYQATPLGFSEELWRQYAELGLSALPFAEEDGGFGGGPVETMLVMEAFGRALALEPYLATVVLAGGLLKRAASAEQRAALIPEIAAGDLRLAFAHSERQSGWNLFDVATSALKDGAGYRLNGEKGLVLHGDSAHKLIVSARSAGGRRERGGLGLYLVDASAPGLARRGYSTQDGQRAAEITLTDVRVEARDVIGDPEGAAPAIERAVDEATAALCAEAVGAMSEALEITVDYLKTRKQFGVADRLVPGAAASRRRHGGGARAGAQHDDAGDDDGGGGRRRRTGESDFGGQGADRPLRPVHRPAGDATARRHRHDLRIQARPSLQAHDDDRHDVRRRGRAFAALERRG